MASPSQGTIVDTTSFSSTFPFLDGSEIQRDNMLFTLELMLEGKVNCVHIEGPSGIGKTTLLAQFARKYHERTISIFSRRSSWFAYDPDFLLYDFCAQTHWLLRKAELGTEIEVDDGLIRRLVYSLRPYSARLGKPIVLVIDGLSEIPQEHEQIRAAVVAKLPLGFEHIKILTSSRSSELGISNSKAKSWQLPAFSLDEAMMFFRQQLPAEAVRRLHEVCRGMPSYFAGVQRLLEKDISIDQILTELPKSMPELFQLEWRSVSELTVQGLEALALLAHDSNRHTINDLGFIFNISSAELRDSFKKLSFVHLPSKDNDEIYFISELFREFASSRLGHLRDTVNKRVIESLLKDQESANALLLLPGYLRTTGDHKRLLQYLSPKRFARMLHTIQRLSPVQQRVLLGLETALEMRSFTDTLSFSMQAAAFHEFSGYRASTAEIEARILLGDDGGAFALAQGAVLKNDRLRLTATFARKLMEQGRSLPKELYDTIEVLFNEADWSDLKPEEVTSLAEDLMYCKPNLAARALEQGIPGTSNSRNTDFAIATLATVASARGNSLSHVDELRSRVRDKNVLSISDAAAALIRSADPRTIISQVERLESARDRLLLLRQWALHTTDDRNAAEILRYSLELSIKTTEFTPDATHLRELAEALRLVEDRAALQEFVKTFDSQRATIAQLGPTADIIHLQLLLALAESRIDRELAGKRLVEICLESSSIVDESLRASAFARFLAYLGDIDTDGSVTAREGLSSLAAEELTKATAALLDSTADHEFATRDIIKALSRKHTRKALDLALDLNMRFRRDRAVLSIVKGLLDSRSEDLDLTQIIPVLDSAADPDTREAAIVLVLDKLSEIRDRGVLIRHAWLIPKLAGQLIDFSDQQSKVAGAANLLLILGIIKDDGLKALEQHLTSEMRKAWATLYPDAEKIELAFKIASILAPAHPDIAREYVTLAEKERNKYTIGSQTENFRYALHLAIRAYCGLVEKGLDGPADASEISTRISRLESPYHQIVLWTDLATKLFKYERDSDARKIVNEKLRPMIEETGASTKARYTALSIASPALFYAGKATALELLSRTPPWWNENGIIEIINFILKKEPHWEPYDKAAEHAYELTIDEVNEICELTSRLSTDSVIYSCIKLLVDTFTSKYGKQEFSSQQRASIHDKLASIIDAKLPDKNNIKHEGYGILARAQLCRLKRRSDKDLEELLQRARKIPNIADRALVISALTRAVLKDAGFDTKALLREATAIAGMIPNRLDRAGRFQTIAEIAASIDRSFSETLLSQALMFTKEEDGPEYEDERKEIIDYTYRFDPEVASRIAAAFDDDPARREKRRISFHLETLKLKRKILDDDIRREQLQGDYKHQLPSAAWGLLASINAGTAVPCHLEQMPEYIERAAQMSFVKAFPIFSFIIGNANSRIQEKGERARMARGMLSAALNVADLFAILGEKTSLNVHASITAPAPIGSKELLVEPGDREKALNFISDWLQESHRRQVVIHDPFLYPEDVVEILKLLLRGSRNTEAVIITSRDALQQRKILEPYSETYRSVWRQSSVQDAPFARIIIVGLEPGGSAPIHERWWIGEANGLEVGSSFNALGNDRITKLSIMSQELFIGAAEKVMGLAEMKTRYQGHSRITYESFNI